jgi:hypothetical protein
MGKKPVGHLWVKKTELFKAEPVEVLLFASMPSSIITAQLHHAVYFNLEKQHNFISVI